MRMWISILYLLLLFSCSKDRIDLKYEPTPQPVDCWTLTTLVEIQYETYLTHINNGGTYESLTEEFFDSWNFATNRLQETNVNVDLMDLRIWTTPDTFSTAANSCTRLTENDIKLGYYNYITGEYTIRDFAHIIMGNGTSKCAWFFPGTSAYVHFPLINTGWSDQWAKYYWTHELGHLAGALHRPDCNDDPCHIMVTYPCYQDCPGIEYSQPWMDISKEEIEYAMMIYHGCWAYRQTVNTRKTECR